MSNFHFGYKSNGPKQSYSIRYNEPKQQFYPYQQVYGVPHQQEPQEYQQVYSVPQQQEPAAQDRARQRDGGHRARRAAPTPAQGVFALPRRQQLASAA